MSILGRIVSSIFGHASAAPASGTAAPGAPAKPATSAPASSAAPASTAKPGTAVDVTSILDKLAASNKEKLDWRHSIVDLMKLLNLDSSLAARKELAEELHFTGDKNDSASMNIWLHKQVMVKLAENGGKVPDELRK
jgi:3-oxoacyl-ACP reductase-like protein